MKYLFFSRFIYETWQEDSVQFSLSLQMIIKTKKVFIGGLSATSTLEDMKSYFEQYGKVFFFFEIDFCAFSCIRVNGLIWRPSETQKRDFFCTNCCWFLAEAIGC